MNGAGTRTGCDLLGEVSLPAGALWGPETERARLNFPVSGRLIHPALIRAGAVVKKACALANDELGYLPPDLAAAIVAACDEIAAGAHADQFVVDALQGGAGTSTNMNLNEVIAALATRRLGRPVDPHAHVNLHQSTNDVYPTAIRIAALRELAALEQAAAELVEAFQEKERAFAGIAKLGRTELRDAVPITLGREFGAYVGALSRDRWRLGRCAERLRVINLGGTAVGTGLAAPRRYIFLVTEKLRAETGLNLARAEDLVDATQNADALVEASAMVRVHAINLVKIARDLRWLSSGPEGGLGEIELPAVQPGSSLMPGKVNPVIPEMVTQAAWRALAHDGEIQMVAQNGELELNAFLPLLADALLAEITLLACADRLFAEKCIRGITARPERCRELLLRSRELATALIPLIGHTKAVALARHMRETGQTLPEAVAALNLLTPAQLEEALQPERLCALGWKEAPPTATSR